MFTGIIENTGRVDELIQKNGNITFWIASSLSQELSIDQSLSHDGVCLTVEEIRDGMHRVTVIEETLSKTNLGHWQNGATINLERCMELNGRLDGHIVQGHVDCVAECIGIAEKEGSSEYRFSFPLTYSNLVIEKGSITLNGISLTVFNVDSHSFTVAIIPYTCQHTNMSSLKKGGQVNIEFDMIGKYVDRIMRKKN